MTEAATLKVKSQKLMKNAAFREYVNEYDVSSEQPRSVRVTAEKLRTTVIRLLW